MVLLQLSVVVLPVIIVVPVIILLRKRILHLLLVDLSISTGIGKRCSNSLCVTSLEGEVTGQSFKGSSSSKNLTGRPGSAERSGRIDVAPPVLVVGLGSGSGPSVGFDIITSSVGRGDRGCHGKARSRDRERACAG